MKCKKKHLNYIIIYLYWKEGEGRGGPYLPRWPSASWKGLVGHDMIVKYNKDIWISDPDPDPDIFIVFHNHR